MCLLDCRIAQGNRGVQVLTRKQDTHYEIVCLSIWQRAEDLQDFVGDIERDDAYQPERIAHLLLAEPQIAHYDMITSELELAHRYH
ncbi:hypothetical protein ccbrp13_62860 [Ktedonobacteria bacterium brp13]|nr:hypothetical protein ccbrp13_62860 [Ktedonobacteria bacterium brp13]